MSYNSLTRKNVPGYHMSANLLTLCPESSQFPVCFEISRICCPSQDVEAKLCPKKMISHYLFFSRIKNQAGLIILRTCGKKWRAPHPIMKEMRSPTAVTSSAFFLLFTLRISSNLRIEKLLTLQG